MVNTFSQLLKLEPPLELEGHRIRIVANPDGKPLVVVKDACPLLGYARTDLATRALKAKDKILVDSQLMSVVDVPSLIVLARKRKREGLANSLSTRFGVTASIVPDKSTTRPTAALAATTLDPQVATALVQLPTLVGKLTELVDLQIARLKGQQAQDRLARFPPSWQVPPDKLRMRVDDLIDTVAEVRGWQRNSVIRQINRVVRDRHHIDFRQRKRWIDQRRGKRVSILNVIEHYDRLPMVYDLAVSYYRDDLRAVPQPRLSDVPLDRDDPMTEEEHELVKVWEFAMGAGPGKEPQ